MQEELAVQQAFFGLSLTGLVTIAIFAVVLAATVAVVLAYFAIRKNARKIADLRKENALLRDEVERLKNGPSAPGSTDFKAL